MGIVYKEISSREEINQCVELQRSVFNLSDTDLISPLFFKLIARNDPPIGITLGVFNSNQNETELIGFIIGFSCFIERSIYSPLVGIKSEYQNKIYGYKLVTKYRQIALSRNIKYFYGIFEALDTNIARFYFSSLGCIAYKYVIDAFFSSETKWTNSIPNDKLLVRWDLESKTTIDRMNGIKKYHIKEIFERFPIATVENMPDLPQILVEIPDNFNQLTMTEFENAKNWRKSTRYILSEYVNNRNYIVDECYSIKINKIRKSYYLLEKK